MQFTIERLFQIRGLKIEVSRFTFCNQIDISQPTTKEFHKLLWMESYDKPFMLKAIGSFFQVDLCKYMSLSVYNKQKSALTKIKIYKNGMTKKEKEYFLKE
jgi:hypothetical protein